MWTKIKKYFYYHRFDFLLGSLMFMMVNSLLFDPDTVRFIIVPIASAITYFCGFLLFSKDKAYIRVSYFIFLIIIYLGTWYFILNALDRDYRQRTDIVILEFLYLLYWVILFRKVIISIFTANEFNLKLVSASISGFIILIFSGATLFNIIDYFHPNSFDGINLSDPNLYDEYIYFSFITQSSIGFGEITPTTNAAKKAVILMGTLGQFYLIILVGLIVSKFAGELENLKEKKRNKNKK